MPVSYLGNPRTWLEGVPILCCFKPVCDTLVNVFLYHVVRCCIREQQTYMTNWSFAASLLRYFAS